MQFVKAIGNRLTIQPDPVKTNTETGLEIPAGSQEKPVTGVVLSKGEDVKEIEIGDRVLYNMFGGGKANIEGQEIYFIRESDVILIISKQA